MPQITLQEMLVAFKDVVARAEMFAHHHVQRERLSVRERMTDILASARAHELRGLPAAVPPRGRPHGRHDYVRRHPRADARRTDRHRAGRAFRATARTQRGAEPQSAAGGGQLVGREWKWKRARARWRSRLHSPMSRRRRPRGIHERLIHQERHRGRDARGGPPVCTRRARAAVRGIIAPDAMPSCARA